MMGVGGVGGSFYGAYTEYGKGIQTDAVPERRTSDGSNAKGVSKEVIDSLTILSGDRSAQFSESNRYIDLFRQLGEARSQGEATAKAFENLRKCIIIAMRIMNGDRVPFEDHRFLLENEPEMYYKALMMRRIKEDPEEYDRISEDEEDGVVESAANPGGGGSSAAAPAVSEVSGTEVSTATDSE